MTTKISTSLYNQNTPVTELIDQIQAKAETRGLTLSRWQANEQHYATTITYALHTGERASQFRRQSNVVKSVFLTHTEGTTDRCQAFRKLTGLYNYLNN